jgi:hypothetical protein
MFATLVECELMDDVIGGIAVHIGARVAANAERRSCRRLAQSESDFPSTGARELDDAQAQMAGELRPLLLD